MANLIDKSIKIKKLSAPFTGRNDELEVGWIALPLRHLLFFLSNVIKM